MATARRGRDCANCVKMGTLETFIHRGIHDATSTFLPGSGNMLIRPDALVNVTGVPRFQWRLPSHVRANRPPATKSLPVARNSSVHPDIKSTPQIWERSIRRQLLPRVIHTAPLAITVRHALGTLFSAHGLRGQAAFQGLAVFPCCFVTATKEKILPLFCLRRGRRIGTSHKPTICGKAFPAASMSCHASQIS